MKYFLLVPLLFIATNVFALISSDGDKFSIQYNKHGAVLSPIKNPNPKTKLYLGKDCDAYSKTYGNGEWSWANGGFVIEFSNKRYGFPRQEVDINNGGGCRM